MMDATMTHDEYAALKGLEELLVKDADIRKIQHFLHSSSMAMPYAETREALGLVLASWWPRMHRFELFLQLDCMGVEAPLEDLQQLASTAPDDIRESMEFGYLCGIIEYRMLNEIL